MTLKDRLRVLVVDDMSTSRGILLQRLDTIGIPNVAHAEDRVAGLCQTRRFRPHLILSDLYMPRLNGLEFLRELRAEPKTHATGFILVTGRADDAIVQAGKELGMNDYLAKPFGGPQLRDCIEAVVGQL